MTKLRAPLSFEQAITVIGGLLGWAEAAAVIGRKERTLRDYGDPDVQAQITLEDAFALDRAYRAAGGDGTPILQCYKFRLDAAAAVSGGDLEALARLAQSVASEGGDAIAALFGCIRPGATPADFALARREIEQALTALSNTLPILDGAGPSSDRVQPRGGAIA
jgi:hypothetical protein